LTLSPLRKKEISEYKAKVKTATEMLGKEYDGYDLNDKLASVYAFWNLHVSYHIQTKCTSDVDVRAFAVITLLNSFRQGGINNTELLTTPLDKTAIFRLAASVKKPDIGNIIMAQLTAFKTISEVFKT